MKTQDYHQRKETANLIGLNYAALPMLSELYYDNRLPESELQYCAFILRAYHDARSNFMRNIYRKQMENVYYTL